MPPIATTTRTIIIKNDVKGLPGLKKVAGQLDRINRNTKKTAKSMGLLSKGFGRVGFAIKGMLAGLGTRRLIEIADDMQLLRDRIKVFTGSTEEAEVVLQELGETALKTRAPLKEIGVIYNRIALATQELGLSQEAIIETVEVLQNTFRLSGATMAEAAGSAIQLSQGLSSGQLRGQELRSVLEANAVFAGLLAKEFGVARGELIKLAEKGEITTARVLKLLADNMDDINKRAGDLKTTVGQAATNALTKFSLAVKDLNDRLGISEGLVKLLDLVSDNFSRTAQIITTIVVGGVLIKLVTQIDAIKKAIIGLQSLSMVALSGKFLAFALAAGAAATAVSLFWDKFFPPTAKEKLDNLQSSIKNTEDALAVLKRRIDRGAADPATFATYERLKKQLDELVKKETEAVSVYDSGSRRAAEGRATNARNGLANATKNLNSKLKKKISFDKMMQKEIALLNRRYSEGVLNVEQYRDALERLEIRQLNHDFKEGKIKVDEYEQSLAKIQRRGSVWATGTQQYLNSIGTLATQVSNTIAQAFGHLEDALVESMKNGKLEFDKFTAAVIEDLNRIIVRSLIIAPLAKGIVNLAAGGVTTGGTAGGGDAGSTVATTPSSNYAMGGVFQNGIQSFANRGMLINGPTLFKYDRGKTGMMGEAGAEAIMPLRRTPSGDLGIVSTGGGKQEVTVNVINENNENEIQTQESERDGGKVIDVIITRKIRESFATGQMDKTMSSLYGINRRGN